MSYELKDEFFYRQEDGKYRGHYIYHLLFAGHNYIINANFRPDDDNGEHEFEMTYLTEEDYHRVTIGKEIFGLYKILTEIYLSAFYNAIKKANDIPHLKFCGFELSQNDEKLKDKRKDNIAINYVKKVLPIEKIFVDCKDNTIIILDKTKL
jgi:hypothetical protein